MDIQKSFTYQFDDETWTNKVLVGAIISAVPILNLAASGYGLDVTKNVIAGEARPLPTWDNIGNQFMRGLIYAIGVLVYFLPLLIIGCLFAVLGGGLSALMGDSQSSDGLAALLTGGGILFGCLTLLYSLAAVVVLPAATVRCALTNQLSEMFKFKDLFADIRRNVSGYLTATVVVIVAAIVVGIVMSMVGGALSIIPICGWIVAWIISAAGSFYLQLTANHLYGPFYRDARAAGAATL